jgi:NlpC/P60 family protein
MTPPPLGAPRRQGPVPAIRCGWALALVSFVIALGGCATKPVTVPPQGYLVVGERKQGRDLAMYAFGLIDIGYRFGGKNPDSGLDCSGMVAYLYDKVIGAHLPHNAADIARLARPIDRSALQAGDLVFFNTRNHPFSHVGIFVGAGRFVHAPSRNGRIRLNSLAQSYYAKRFDGARTLLSD